MDKNFLIAGATGRTGRLIVQKLLDRDDKPRVLVRNHSLAENLFGNLVDIYQGDVRHPESLLPAMESVDTVISAIGTRTPVGKNCPKRVDFEGVANLVQAARVSGVKRFVLISSISVTQPDHPLNCFGKVLDWKFKGENALRKSGLNYAIIRPGGLIDTHSEQKLLIFDQGDKISGTISRIHLAETCLCAADYPNDMRLTFEVIESGEQISQNCGEVLSSLKMDANLKT